MNTADILIATGRACKGLWDKYGLPVLFRDPVLYPERHSYVRPEHPFFIVSLRSEEPPYHTTDRTPTLYCDIRLDANHLTQSASFVVKTADDIPRQFEAAVAKLSAGLSRDAGIYEHTIAELRSLKVI